MKVIPFEEKYRRDFIDFNTDWIISNFGFLEEHDRETFEKIDPHKGAGSAVFEAAMQWAFQHGAERLFILSNSKLKAAIHIYEKYGFQEIKLDNYGYIRGDIAFEYIRKD